MFAESDFQFQEFFVVFVTSFFLVPENTKVDDSDQIYFQDGQKASSMKGKMKRPDNVQDMAMGWSKQYG